MNVEEALKINGQLTRAYIATTVGLGPDVAIPDVSLSDMIEASHIVRESNKGPHLHTFCDDRAIAALYCLKHFDGCDSADIEPTAVAEGKALCIVTIKNSPQQSGHE